MGLQNATLERIDGLAVHTTYVSSVVTGLASALAQLAMPAGRSGGRSGQRATMYAALWAGYLVGATGASIVQQGWGLVALVLPLVALGVVLVLDHRHPHELGGPPP